jgi:hypothetical protein
MIVQGALGDASSGRDLVDSDGKETLSPEKFVGCLQYALAGVVR